MAQNQKKIKKTTKTTSRTTKTSHRTKKPAKKPIKKQKATKKKRKTTRKPKNTDIVIASPVAPNTQIVMASELADDEMIEKELMGEVMPYFVYKFENRGKEIIGLTVKGVNETVRRLNRDKRSGLKIRINPEYLKIERDVEYDGQKGVEVSVFGENLVDGNSGWGVKFEPYFKIGKNGKYKNEFAVEKALSKAERNAKRKLIPEVLATKTIEKIMTSSPESVRRLEAPKPQFNKVAPLPPKASGKKDIEGIVRNMVNDAKTIDELIDISEKLIKSPKHTAGFKKEMSAIIKNKVDKLQ